MNDDIDAQLRAYGTVSDDDVPLAEVALLLSATYHRGRGIDQYRHHLNVLAQDVESVYNGFISSGAVDGQQDVFIKIKALRHVFVDMHHYTGDTDYYDDVQNADVMRVIDRRKGLPVALSLLVIDVARRLNWQVYGLNFPKHFLVRVDDGAQRAIIDPFHGFKIMDAPDLRALVKRGAGPMAELSAHYYDAVSNRDILLRLQNNIKTRMIEAEDYNGAWNIVRLMQLIAPDDYRLWFDAGVLLARLGRVGPAIAALERYITAPVSAADRRDALVLLAELRQK